MQPHTAHRIIATIILSTVLSACGASGGSQDQLQPLPRSSSLTLQAITANLSAPVFMTAPANDVTRLFIVEQGGLIRIFDLIGGSLRATPFLDISDLLSTGGEQGLLGMACDPNYAANRRFYVYYINTTGDLVIARYLRDANNADLADGSSATILLTVSHPNFSNHNGGMFAFGPDQCLYAGPGDGGSGGDPGNNAQDPNERLGKILRLDPNSGGLCANAVTNPFVGGGGAPEVWGLGLRNPWRFSFDRQTGDLYIADVGQSAREEINVSVPPNAGRGLNYGWRLMEGFLCFNPPNSCNPGGPLTLPVLDYPHAGGACSITGGYVYRGQAAPSLSGSYFYADFCLAFVRSFRLQNGQATEQTEWPLLSPPGGFITSFAEDARGELHLMTQGGGLFKVVPNT